MLPPLTQYYLTLLLLFFTFPSLSSSTTRHLLHHPFIPSLSLSPSPSPSPSPKLPFSTTTTPSLSPPTTPSSFFPSLSSPPPPPSPPTAIPTFPANISSLALPTHSTTPNSSSHHSLSPKYLITLSLLSFLVLSLLLSLTTILLRRRHNHRHISHAPPPKPPRATSLNNNVSNTSSEFLYLGTISNTTSREFQPQHHHQPSTSTSAIDEHSELYLKLCGHGNESPELKPLPPLPKRSFHHHVSFEFHDQQKQQDDQFFSPTASSSANNLRHSGRLSFRSGNSSFRDDNNSYLTSSSPENIAESPARHSDVSVEIQELLSQSAAAPPVPPPPPPAPVARSWASSGSGGGSGTGIGPPVLFPPSGPVALRRSGNLVSGESSSSSGGGGEKRRSSNGEIIGMGKTKLKALHWDKVRASSDRVMVWDQLQPGSFQLNEEMIETLFKANGPAMGTKDGARRSIMPLLNEETRVLDPKKSQNVAILLRALNVTVEEVCEALVEGNADALGTELLESLLKMAPTKEEERKLKEYNDESPLKLGPAEKFLKAVLDVPFAFKRLDAMLYMTTFDSEVEYLRKSFETLEAACEELRKSRMFLKLLEAVLKTGNRMNVGTNRGDAQAFKLDTLLKLIDIKGTDGKTTLLHFVVQEIIKAEGARLSHPNQESTAAEMYVQPALHNDIELRKQGLEVVAGLGGELSNVKKAAGMDSDALSSDVAKLARGVIKVNEVLQLNEGTGMIESNRRFSESMNGFLKKAELEIVRIQSQESGAFSRVKELTEYFHGNLAKEVAHPLRIFLVVRDFLSVLEQVCKEVGKINERTTISSARPFTVSVNQNVPPPFPAFTGVQRDSSSDDESLVLT